MKNRNVIFKSIVNLRVFLLFSILVLSFMLVGNVSAVSHTLTLTSSGSQDINISASAGTAISSDAINVSTTCRYGYNFTINTSVSDNNLYLGGDSSNNTEGTYFSPTDGTTALNATTNKWGYYYNASTAPTNTSVFSPVPTLSTPATVKTPLTTPSSSDINDNFNIYYGVSSAPTMAKGTYKMIPDTNNSNNDGTIVYTATIADTCTKYTVHFDPTGTNMGMPVSGGGTMDDQLILEGVTENLASNTFLSPIGWYFMGWNTEQDGSGTSYSDGQSVTSLASAGETITLYAQWTNCPSNTICYTGDLINPSSVEGEMGNQTISNSDTSATLWAPNYKREGYGFAGWNTKVDGSGWNYGPNETIEFTEGKYSTAGLSLYARWIESEGDMQGWSGCSSMSNGGVIALMDARDNNVYAVAKLADGKCWMIENLRLADKDANSNDINLSSSNTHNPSLPLTNSDSTTSNHLSPTTDPTSTAWCQNANSACIDQSMLATNNTTLFTSNTASGYSASSNVYSYGNYYNWYSATGGHGRYGSSYGSGYNAPGDICPTGWRLPKGGNKSQESTNEFWQLIVTDINNGVNPANYNSSTYPNYTGNEATPIANVLSSYPNNFIYSGYVRGSSVGYRSSDGLYWAASAYNSEGAYGMYFSNNGVYPGTDRVYKYGGRVVRCIAGV